jgi:hypothetical protein
MPFDPKDVRNVAVVLALGGIAGAAVIQSHHDEKRKSQAEKDDPDRTEWICGLVWDLLDDWEPPDFEREDEYTDDLAQFLREELRSERGDDGRRISVIKRTKTAFGVPDVLIDDRLVLELKVNPRETEKDPISRRLVGGSQSTSVTRSRRRARPSGMRLAERAAAFAAYFRRLRATDKQQTLAGCNDGRAWSFLAVGESSHRGDCMVRSPAEGAGHRHSGGPSYGSPKFAIQQATATTAVLT